jgi:hypothetical protein
MSGSVQDRINRLTTQHVRRMILALRRQPTRDYATFKLGKRAVYRLYPDNPEKARAIVRFALHQSGFLQRVKPTFRGSF